MINMRENLLIFYQILSTRNLRKETEVSLENLCVDIGAYRATSTSCRGNYPYICANRLSNFSA